MADAIRACALDRAPFDALLEAREADLEEEGPGRSRGAGTHYAAATGGSLAELMVRACGTDSGESLEAGRHVGTAWALIGALRAAPLAAAQGRVKLPADLLTKRRDHGVEDRAGGPGVRPLRRRR